MTHFPGLKGEEWPGVTWASWHWSEGWICCILRGTTGWLPWGPGPASQSGRRSIDLRSNQITLRLSKTSTAPSTPPVGEGGGCIKKKTANLAPPSFLASKFTSWSWSPLNMHSISPWPHPQALPLVTETFHWDGRDFEITFPSLRELLQMLEVHAKNWSKERDAFGVILYYTRGVDACGSTVTHPRRPSLFKK